MRSNKIVGETINVGNNFEISIREIVKIMKEDFGYDFNVVLDKKNKRKRSEVFRLLQTTIKQKIIKLETKVCRH